MLFQFHDSNIAEIIMRNLLRKKILVLPVHDSFIVEEKYGDVLLMCMKDAFNQYKWSHCQPGIKAKKKALQQH